MATVSGERDLLAGGTEQSGTVRSVWAQNVWFVNGAISVRPGWGQVAELDTTLGLNTSLKSNIGYQDHLGSAFIRTSFGHDQVLSLFFGRSSSGAILGETKQPEWDNYYYVRIYDITTDRHWEEVLDHQTSSYVHARPVDANFLPTTGSSFNSEWHGTYGSSYDVDNTNLVAGTKDSKFFFHTFQGNLFFGTPGAGIFVYLPTDFINLRVQQIPTSEMLDWHNGLSESPLVVRLAFSPGIHEDAWVYIDKSHLSSPVAATTLRNSMAIATESEIFISDAGRPQNIIGANVISVPSSRSLTAIHELRGNLLIFTDKETFLYVPSDGELMSRGRTATRISDSIGCIGPQAITMMDEHLVWVSSTGVHRSIDGASIEELSAPIRSLWGDFGLMTNPMTSYFETAAADPGHVDIRTIEPPRTLLRFEPENVTLAYDHLRRTLLLGAPNLNGCFAFSNLWSFWPSESIVSQDAFAAGPVVNTSANLVRPWVLSTGPDLLMVSGVTRDSVGDAGVTIISGAPDVSLPCSSGNFVLCRLGLGGALDRSCENEDYRRASGKYVSAQNLLGGLSASEEGAFYFRPPVYEARNSRYWVPVELVVPQESAPGVVFGPIEKYEVFFKFDSAHWDPEAAAGTAALTLSFPTERVESIAGVFKAFRTDALKVASVVGDYIHVVWDPVAAAAPNTWFTYPAINLARRRPNPLFSFSMKPIAGTVSVAGFGIRPDPTDMAVYATGLAQIQQSMNTIVWIEHFIGSDDSHNLDAKVQAVDWCYKGQEASEGSGQIRARGLDAIMSSHGSSTSPIIPGWVWGVYNVLLGSDAKEYSSQVVDYAGDISKIENKLTIRSRFRNVAGSLVTRTFGANAKWGAANSIGQGDYLIDDTETDHIATSDSVKGSRISYMVFGFMRNRAEALSLQRLTGVFRRAGGRRRIGR